MDFVAVVDQAIALLRQRGRLTYGTLKRQFQLDDAALDDLTDELIIGQRPRLFRRGFQKIWWKQGLDPGVCDVPGFTPAGGRAVLRHLRGLHPNERTRILLQRSQP